MNLDLLRRLKAPELIVPGRKPPRSTDANGVSDANRIAYWPMREGAGHAIDEVSGQVLTLEGNTVWRGGSIYTPGGTTDYATADLSKPASGVMTLAFEHTVTATPTTDGIINWHPSNPTSTTPFLLFQALDATTNRLMVNAGYRITVSVSVGKKYRWAIVYDGSDWLLYQDGYLAGSYTGPLGTRSGTKMWLGTGYASRTIGLFDSFCYDDRAWSPGEVEAWSRDPNIFLDFNALYVWDEAGGGGVSLVIADSAHGHIADNMVLTQAHQLGVDDADHAHTADEIVLQAAAELGINRADHAHSADNLVLTQAHILVVQNSTLAHAADNLVLQSAGTLDIAGGLSAHTANNIDLTQAHILAIADAAHAHAADNVTLDSSAIVVIQDSTHAHAADSLALTQAHALDIAGALHAHLADNINVGVDHATLIISDTLHAHLADQCNVSESITAVDTPYERIFMIQRESRIIFVSGGSRSIPIQ